MGGGQGAVTTYQAFKHAESRSTEVTGPFLLKVLSWGVSIMSHSSGVINTREGQRAQRGNGEEGEEQERENPEEGRGRWRKEEKRKEGGRGRRGEEEKEEDKWGRDRRGQKGERG